MDIREIKLEDAEMLISLIKQVESESRFMLMEAGERKTTPEQQRKQLETIIQQSNSTVLVAEEEGELAGYLIAIGGSVKKTRHSAYLVIGILEKYRGKGIGTALFQQLEVWAKSQDILRLELTIVIENEAGVTLYKRRGFEIEGVKRKSILIDGEFFDQYLMAKLL